MSLTLHKALQLIRHISLGFVQRHQLLLYCVLYSNVEHPVINIMPFTTLDREETHKCLYTFQSLERTSDCMLYSNCSDISDTAPFTEKIENVG